MSYTEHQLYVVGVEPLSLQVGVVSKVVRFAAISEVPYRGWQLAAEVQYIDNSRDFILLDRIGPGKLFKFITDPKEPQ